MAVKQQVNKNGDKRGKSPKKNMPAGKKFSADYQPSGKAKSLGKAVKAYNRDMAKQIRDMPYNLDANPNIKEAIEKGFGIKVAEWPSFAIGQMRLQQRLILQPTEGIFNAILNQTEGMPKQPTEHSGEVTVNNNVVVDFKDAE